MTVEGQRQGFDFQMLPYLWQRPWKDKVVSFKVYPPSWAFLHHFCVFLQKWLGKFENKSWEQAYCTPTSVHLGFSTLLHLARALARAHVDPFKWRVGLCPCRWLPCAKKWLLLAATAKKNERMATFPAQISLPKKGSRGDGNLLGSRGNLWKLLSLVKTDEKQEGQQS